MHYGHSVQHDFYIFHEMEFIQLLILKAYCFFTQNFVPEFVHGFNKNDNFAHHDASHKSYYHKFNNRLEYDKAQMKS